ncbi:hypothetical protein M3N55_07255 [Roseibaca sp. V10]|uniref:Long-chain fatty acid transport protein n=1 Tax=Roseinatronobacter domitianus TaxID=2940293 RepID=A0ABT0M2A1_9RHOB|nr:hypothetical protein [Roseibaca domitiana]MCL1628525.1 hypothetical protein [Roseibaca domitiana]
MRNGLMAALACAVASPALAGGVERSTQPMSILFEEGRYLEAGASFGSPSLTGNLAAGFGSSPTGNIAKSFFTGAIGYKADINDKLSYAIIFDEPIGADVVYPAGSALATLSGEIKSKALTGVLRYKFGGGVSAYAGLRSVWTSGAVSIPAAVVSALGGPAADYVMTSNTDQAFGYLVGVAYEKPEIALRVALTYQSEIEHGFTAQESFGGAPLPATGFSSTIPDSLTLDFRSGVAKDTLVFGSVRWVNWKDFVIPAPALGVNIVSYPKNSITYTLGVGRKFTENWSGSISVSHDTGTGNPTSNLGPVGKRNSIGLGVSYTRDAMTISAGVQYSHIGSATTTLGSTFDDNSAVGAGMRVGFRF